MSRIAAVCLSTLVALVALTSAPLFHPSPVLAASGTLSVETPLHDSPDPAAAVIALLPEGTVVSIDGPPVDGFYPVTASNLSGWMRGETVLLEKDPPALDDAEEGAVDSPPDQTDEMNPAGAPAELDPATDVAISPTSDPASDPDVDPSAAPAASPPVADSALGDEVVPPGEPVPAEELPPANESAPVDEPPVDDAAAAPPAPDPASEGEATPVLITSDGAASPPDSAATASEVAAEPATDSIVTPIPIAEISPVGPASVAVDAPILAGPGPDYGFIAMATAGSTVEKTGHVIGGYVTVQYGEVTGWVALETLGVPSTRVFETPPAQTPSEKTVLPIESPPTDTVQAEPPPTELVPTEALPGETPPPDNPALETLPVEPASGDAAPVEPAPSDGAPGDPAPVDVAPN